MEITPMHKTRLDYMSRLATLLYFRTLADLESEVKKTYISFGWWLLEPLLLIAVYFIALAVFLDLRQERFLPILMVGVVTYQFFSRAVSRSAESILSSGPVISKIPIEKLFFPSTIIATDFVKFLVAQFVLIMSLWVIGEAPTFTLLWAPVVLLQETLLIAAFAFWLALAVPFIPDVKIALPVVLTGGAFLSGVFYTVDRLPEHIQPYFLMNPMASVIDNWRRILLDNSAPDLLMVLIVSAASIALILLAQLWSRRFSTHYIRLVAQ